MSSSRNIPPALLLLAWCLINLLQAALSPLDPDETYYWMYAQQLDWGYFDHPPAVALLVSLGKDWLPGALGLRFGHVLAGTATLAVMYRLLDRPRGAGLYLLAGLLVAQPMLQVYGFIATPDGPLLLFSALYLLAFRSFLRRPSAVAGLWWGLTMAGLLYSKYHGVVLILFSVLPCLGYLLRQPGAWVAALSGALLFAPHLYWQYANDYPSFRYHLSGRDDPYQFKYTLQYLLNQLVIFSPLLLYYYARTFINDRASDRFERCLRWLVVGFLTFFLYTTTKGGTEAQWTALLCLPLVYLTYHATLRHPQWRRGLLRMCLITAALIGIGRVLLVAPRDWLPFAKPFDHAPWVARLSARAGELPVVVENSYRLASLYQFYSGGKSAWTFTDVKYRPNQYDLWQDDTLLHGRPVLVMGQGDWKDPTAQPFTLPKGRMLTRPAANFQVAKQVKVVADTLPRQLGPGQEWPLGLTATSPFAARFTGADPALDLFAVLQYPGGEQRFWRLTPLLTDTIDGPTALFTGPLRVPRTAPPGEATLSFALGYRGMPPLRGQSEPAPLLITVAE